MCASALVRSEAQQRKRALKESCSKDFGDASKMTNALILCFVLPFEHFYLYLCCPKNQPQHSRQREVFHIDVCLYLCFTEMGGEILYVALN